MVAERLMGAPYVAGGRSFHGIDSAALVQLSLSLCGIAAPRLTEQQRELAGVLDLLRHHASHGQDTDVPAASDAMRSSCPTSCCGTRLPPAKTSMSPCSSLTLCALLCAAREKVSAARFAISSVASRVLGEMPKAAGSKAGRQPAPALPSMPLLSIRIVAMRSALTLCTTKF